MKDLQGDILATIQLIICLGFLRQSSIYLIKEKGLTRKKKFKLKKKASSLRFISPKISQKPTMQMVKRLPQIHQHKLNVCCVPWNKELEVLTSMWTKLNQSSSYYSILKKILNEKPQKLFWFDFFVLITYQPLWVIQFQDVPCRRRAMVPFDLWLQVNRKTELKF